MEKRREELAESFGVPAERMFGVLVMPTAIRRWFGASSAIIDPREGGSWVTGFGEGERDVDFVSSFRIVKFEPPTRMVLGAGKLFTEHKWPIATSITTEFIVEPQPEGCVLRIVQELAPHDPLLDDYFDACVVGWQNSFAGIRNYLLANAVE